MTLTDPQWRVLLVLSCERGWLTLPALERLQGLQRGDTETVGSLVDLHLAELNSGLRVRLTPAGQVVAEAPRQ